ncbi:MAG: hypothetical protein AAF215_18755 [Cyanobacteria bacterium P01_A01_bin.123]
MVTGQNEFSHSSSVVSKVRLQLSDRSPRQAQRSPSAPLQRQTYYDHKHQQTPAQRLSKAINDLHKLRNYADMIYRAESWSEMESGQSKGTPALVDESCVILDSLTDELSELHAGLLYGRPQIQAQLTAQERAVKYQTLIRGLPVVAAYLHDISSEVFGHLDVYASIEARLNRPPAELRGQPLTAQRFPSEVIEIRRHCIQKTISNDQGHTERYTFQDDQFWRFRYTAIPLYGAEEVLCVIEDDQDWQLGYWTD